MRDRRLDYKASILFVRSKTSWEVKQNAQKSNLYLHNYGRLYKGNIFIERRASQEGKKNRN